MKMAKLPEIQPRGAVTRGAHPVDPDAFVDLGDWQGDPEGQQAALDAIRVQIAKIEATEPLVSAQRIEAIYVPWGIDQAKRTPYLWAAVACWAIWSILLPRAAATV